MARQYGTSLRDNILDQKEAHIGTAPVMRFYTGSMPANAAAATTGTQLAEITLPSDWMAASSGGVKAKSGTWEDISADNAGAFGYYRIWDSTVTTCHEQGLCGASGDLVTDVASVAAGQTFRVTAYTETAPGA